MVPPLPGLLRRGRRVRISRTRGRSLRSVDLDRSFRQWSQPSRGEAPRRMGAQTGTDRVRSRNGRRRMSQLVSLSRPALPVLVAASGRRAGARFLEFFVAQIRNTHTRRAYARGDDHAPLTVIGVWSALEKAAADGRIKAVVLQPEGLSAGWAKLEELRLDIDKFKKSGKPVFAYLRQPGTREYYVASGADRIYLGPSAGRRRARLQVLARRKSRSRNAGTDVLPAPRIHPHLETARAGTDARSEERR